MREWIETDRDLEAVQVPYGNPLRLPAGSRVRVTQELGTSVTVETDTGYLLRLSADDRPAIGLPLASGGPPPGGPITREQVWQLLREVYDPEIPINIVDLGLIYDVALQPDGEGVRVTVTMTVTAPGCGMGDVLKQEIEALLSALPGCRGALVEVVLDPPWDPSRMSEAARLEAGLL